MKEYNKLSDAIRKYPEDSPHEKWSLAEDYSDVD